MGDKAEGWMDKPGLTESLNAGGWRCFWAGELLTYTTRACLGASASAVEVAGVAVGIEFAEAAEAAEAAETAEVAVGIEFSEAAVGIVFAEAAVGIEIAEGADCIEVGEVGDKVDGLVEYTLASLKFGPCPS